MKSISFSNQRDDEEEKLSSEDTTTLALNILGTGVLIIFVPSVLAEFFFLSFKSINFWNYPINLASLNLWNIIMNIKLLFLHDILDFFICLFISFLKITLFFFFKWFYSRTKQLICFTYQIQYFQSLFREVHLLNVDLKQRVIPELISLVNKRLKEVIISLFYYTYF